MELTVEEQAELDRVAIDLASRGDVIISRHQIILRLLYRGSQRSLICKIAILPLTTINRLINQ